MTAQQPRQGARMSRPVKITLGIVGVLVAIPVIAIIILLTFDWNRAKPWLNDKVSDAIGRPFAVNGDLIVKWRGAEGETGWRSWIPWPRLVARDISIGNPDWARSADHLLRARAPAHSSSASGFAPGREMVKLPKAKPKSQPWPRPEIASEIGPFVIACASAELTAPACAPAVT